MTKPTIATGALAAGMHLFIMTIEYTADGTCCLKEDQTDVFELRERNADTTRDCAERIDKFLRSASIERIALRYKPDTGRYRPHPHALKLEAILQLAPSAKVELVASNSVLAWIKREAPELPRTLSLDLARLGRGAGEKAIEVAAYAAAVLSQGSAAPDVLIKGQQ